MTVPVPVSKDKVNFLRKDGIFACIPARYMLATMGFFAILMEYMLKTSLSVIIVAMVHQEPTKEGKDGLNTTQLDVCPGSADTSSHSVSNGEFDWDQEVQGNILSAASYGVLVTHMLGGRLSEVIGFKYVLGPGILLTGLFTAICPFAARWGVAAFITLRVLIGVVSGVVLPSLHVLIAKWFPVEERQTVSSIIYAGIPLGTVLAMSLSGIIAEHTDWATVFYLFGILGILWYIPWQFLAYDSPENHPRISEEEKVKIITSLKQQSKKAYPVPWLAILTSMPLWAYVIMSLGYAWIGSTLLSELPTYLSKVLHFNLQKSGVVSALPFLFAPFGGILFGGLAQKLRASGRLSPITIIRIFNTISAVGSSLFLFVITMVGCDSTAIVVLLIVSMLCVAAFCGGSLTNHLDLGSNFAGTTSGISTTFSSVTGILTPVTVGALTNGNQTIGQWHIVFYISIVITLLSYIFFMIFGTADEQPWNSVPSEGDESKEPVDSYKNNENSDRMDSIA